MWTRHRGFVSLTVPFILCIHRADAQTQVTRSSPQPRAVLAAGLARHSLVFATLPSPNNAYKVAIHHTEL